MQSVVIQAAFLAPGCDLKRIEYDASDYQMTQALVGGSFSASNVYDDEYGEVSAYYHDEGLLIGLPPNFVSPTGAFIVGNVVFCRIDGEGNTENLRVGDFEKLEAFVKTCERVGHVEYHIPDPIIATSQADLDAQIVARGDEKVHIVSMEGLS